MTYEDLPYYCFIDIEGATNIIFKEVIEPIPYSLPGNAKELNEEIGITDIQQEVMRIAIQYGFHYCKNHFEQVERIARKQVKLLHATY
ncbi:hypothetical protein [Listeria aquatica]|uniref:Uncharacterized protein n=1 Tax=Listeria aquatica FSL S10-1188 TaxID=1265818 RepID=W7B1F6_9LIST|nr:hypothetical protein [Listeria aquatica]EUJ16521.1 hypothetical protein MAQA_16061 [Listeria aquatica FSL S10-1188]